MRSETETRALLERTADLLAAGRLDAAEAGLRPLLEIAPPAILGVLALCEITFRRRDPVRVRMLADFTLRLIASAAPLHHRRMLILHPGHHDAWNNWGVLLRTDALSSRADTAYRRAITTNPAHGPALANHAAALNRTGACAAALVQANRSALARPDLPRAWSLGGEALRHLGQTDAACQRYRRAMVLQPTAAGHRIGRAIARYDAAQIVASMRDSRMALVLEPAHALGWNVAGLAFGVAGRTDTAIRCHSRSRVIDLLNPGTWTNLGNALGDARRLRAALRAYHRALVLDPVHGVAASNKILAMEFLEGLDFAAHGRERRGWDRRHARPLAALALPHGNPPDPGRRLTVGYVSADFREQSAAYCFGPVIENHDRRDYRVICYSGVRVEDGMTARFRAACDAWVDAIPLTDDGLAERIRQDGVDILVDLSGHLAGNRLAVFARKPAPIQITAWGLASGTGLSTMDGLLSDPIGIPQKARRHVSEPVIDLPCQIPLVGPADAPDPGPLPATANGFVTFGYLGRFHKISPLVLDVWAALLARLADSRMVLKDRLLGDRQPRAETIAAFARRGISGDRLTFLGNSPRRAHMETYTRVDIALDSFPFGGGVTTLEALWMGVPVVSILGNSQPERIGGAILGAVGLDDWIADDPEDYARIALHWASKRRELEDLRAGLRDRIRRSEAGDPTRYTRAVEAAYRQAWRQWCDKRNR